MIRLLKDEKDLNYVIDAHWRIYSDEYHYDESFIGFFTDAIKTHFQDLDISSNQMWVLEEATKLKGCIAIVKSVEGVAQLRWLLLEPDVRSKGFGRELVKTAIDYCKDVGINKVFLWTNNSLVSARAIYNNYGFRIVKTRTRLLSSQELIEEKWELNI